MRSGAVTLGVLLAVAVAPAASAAVIPGQVIAGPSAEILSAPVIDIAPDGTGVLAFRRSEGMAARLWAARRIGGVWQPPQQLTSGVQTTPLNISVGAGNGGKAIVSFKGASGANDANFRYAPGAGQPFGPITAIKTGGVQGVVAATNAAGVSYALVTTPPANQDVFAYRIVGTTVTPVQAGQALDNVQANIASSGPHSLAVDAAGNAVATWNETGTVFARRLVGTAFGGPAVNARVTSLEGFPAEPGGPSTAAVATDDSGRAWLALLQEFNYGGGTLADRGLVRRFVGNAFEAPLRTDTMPASPPAGREVYLPRIAVTPSGGRALATGHYNVGAAFAAPYLGFGATLSPGAVNSRYGLHSTPTAEETFESVAIVPRGAGLFAHSFQPSSTGPASLQARVVLESGQLAPVPITLSDPALGNVLGDEPSIAADGADSVSVGYLQGTGATTRILVARVDLPRPPAAAAAAADRTAPRVTRFSLSRKRFRKGTKLPKLSAVKTGTTIRFRLSEKATVRLSFERKRPGRRVGKRCRKPSRKNRKRKRCTRYVKVKTAIRLNGKAGSNRVRFQGRLSRRRSLAPGSYRVTLAATDAAKNASKRQRKAFKLLKAAKRKR